MGNNPYLLFFFFANLTHTIMKDNNLLEERFIMKITVNKEQMINIGKAGAKIGKQIIIDGTKSVAGKTALTVISKGMNDGFDSIKELKLDNLLKGKTKLEDKPKKESYFKRRKRLKELDKLTQDATEISIVKDDVIIEVELEEVVKED